MFVVIVIYCFDVIVDDEVLFCCDVMLSLIFCYKFCFGCFFFDILEICWVSLLLKLFIIDFYKIF